jgi:hypothetical protein
MAAFADHAATLLANGYSPLPLRPNRLPLHKGWQALRTTPMTPDAIANERWYGLGVMCGYSGLLAIDVDVDDNDIIAAVTRAVPKSNVAKVGSKGFTVFYRATAEIKNRKFKLPGSKRPIIEVLSGGNMTVVPPTWHPLIGRPYEWVTPGSLFNLAQPELVGFDPDHIEELARALEPWCGKREFKPAPTIERELVDDHRMGAYARSCIRTASTRLSALSGSGRHDAVFCAACGLGRYVHNGIISEHELRAVLMGAADANGIVKERGYKEMYEAITRGLDYSRADALPDLDQIPGAKPRIPTRWDQYLEMAAMY